MSQQQGSSHLLDRSWTEPASTSQLEFDLRFFRALTARSPEYVDALWVLSDLLMRCGYFEECLEVDRRLVRLRPEDPTAHYNLACSLARVGQVEEAFQALERSLALGFNDPAQLAYDQDLDPLRACPRFRQLLHQHGLA